MSTTTYVIDPAPNRHLRATENLTPRLRQKITEISVFEVSGQPEGDESTFAAAARTMETRRQQALRQVLPGQRGQLKVARPGLSDP